jgi:hypothetical protein
MTGSRGGWGQSLSQCRGRYGRPVVECAHDRERQLAVGLIIFNLCLSMPLSYSISIYGHMDTIMFLF